MRRWLGGATSPAHSISPTTSSCCTHTTSSSFFSWGCATKKKKETKKTHHHLSFLLHTLTHANLSSHSTPLFLLHTYGPAIGFSLTKKKNSTFSPPLSIQAQDPKKKLAFAPPSSCQKSPQTELITSSFENTRFAPCPKPNKTSDSFTQHTRLSPLLQLSLTSLNLKFGCHLTQHKTTAKSILLLLSHQSSKLTNRALLSLSRNP